MTLKICFLCNHPSCSRDTLQGVYFTAIDPIQQEALPKQAAEALA